MDIKQYLKQKKKMVKTTTTIDLTGTTVNYTQIVPMTFEEKVNMYMRCSKLELARMLAERNRTEQQIQPYVYPWYPQLIGPNYVTCDKDGYSTTCTYN